MKKVLSILLTSMMLVSLFAVNTSAMIGYTYTEVEGATDEIIFVNQDFSDTEKPDFSAGSYGTATVEDGCLSVSGAAAETRILHVSSPTPIDATQWTVEFDVKRNSDFESTSYYGVTVMCDKAAYEKNEEKIAQGIENYGVYIPLSDIEKNVWYTYRITFSEQGVLDSIVKNGADKHLNTYADALISSAFYKKEGSSEWSEMRVKGGTWNHTSGQIRAVLYKQGVGYGYLGYPVEIDGVNSYSENEVSFTFHSPHSEYRAPLEEELAANFSLDNIKTYVAANPGEEITKEYPLTNGTIHLTSKAPGMPDATLGVQDYMSTPFTTNINTSVAGTTDYFAVTFDAKNTVQGMPIMFHIGGDNVADGIAICPTDIIGTDWYTYKIICSQTSSGGYTGFVSVFRKPTGSDEGWTTVNVAPKYGYNPGDEIWACSTPSGGKNCIRIFYYPASSAAMYPGTKWEDTVWEVKDLQVTDEAVISGFANAENGQISVDAEIIAATDDAGVALAVYNNNILSDVAFTRILSGSGELDLTADYTEGNDAKLMVWSYFNNNAKPLIAPIDISAIAD